MFNNKIICKTCNNKLISHYYYRHKHIKSKKHIKNLKKYDLSLDNELPGSEITQYELLHIKKMNKAIKSLGSVIIPIKLSYIIVEKISFNNGNKYLININDN